MWPTIFGRRKSGTQFKDIPKFAATILENNFEGVLIADGTKDHLILYVNKAWEKASGWTREEVVGKYNPRILKSGKHGIEFYKKMWDTILSGQLFHAEITNKRKSGELYIAEVNIFPITTEDGHLAYAEISRDITAEKGAQRQFEELRMQEKERLVAAVEEKTQELSESERRLQTFVKYGVDVIAIVNRETKILFISPSVKTIYGYEPEELIGTIGLSLVHPDDRERMKQGITDLIASQKKSITTELRLIKKDGTWIWIEGTIANFLDDPGINAIVTNFHDITKYKELDRAKTEFISIASHQLRTPLSITKWVIELLMEDKKVMPRKMLVHIMDIYHSNERLIKIVDDLLSVAKIESGQLAAASRLANIHDLIQNTIDSLKEETKRERKKINFVSEVRETSTLTDPSLFNNALRNILDNAIAYSPPRSIVDVILKQEGQNLITAAYNEGPTIPKERFFQKFYRGEEAQKNKPAGSGLGLVIAKMEIEAIGGRIWLESPAPGHKGGVAVYISLPIKTSGVQ